MTDEAIAALVGKTADFSMFGEPVGKVLVTHAQRVDDAWMGPGVWVVAERIPVPRRPRDTDVVLGARLCKLDADGQPVGEWFDLEGTT